MFGERYLKHILNHADIFPCEQIEEVADRFIEACHIQIGAFDNVAACKYDVPTYWDIGAVYYMPPQYLQLSYQEGKLLD